jgi:hypothetical protein
MDHFDEIRDLFWDWQATEGLTVEELKAKVEDIFDYIGD